MAELKIKVPPILKRRQSESRVSSPQAESSSSQSKKKRRINTEEKETLYEQETEQVDIVGDSELRSYQNEDLLDPAANGLLDDDSRLPTATSKRRQKKKKHIVYSDIEDTDFPASEVFQNDDKDEDFIPELPPRNSKTKMKAKASTSKVKSRIQKAGSKDVMTTSKSLDPMLESIDPEDIDITTQANDKVLNGFIAQELVDTSPEKESETLPTPENVTPKKKKLPTIKKNKTLVTHSSSATIVAAISSATAVSNVAGIVNRDVSSRKPAATAGNADVDLTNTDIYNSLFKSNGGGVPRTGLNRREKEEERRKELGKMRDQARERRMAQLKIGSFDFISDQEKMLDFEAKLRERNSAALFPHYLAACLKQKKK